MTTCRLQALLGLLALGACEAEQAATAALPAAVATDAAPASARPDRPGRRTQVWGHSSGSRRARGDETGGRMAKPRDEVTWRGGQRHGSARSWRRDGALVLEG